MAELPRYQQTGRNYSDAPAFDFANIRESARASQSLSQGLDRLSTFAYKAAGDYAEKKAEQDAVSNPITLEQLQIAQQSGIDPEDLVKAAGGGTIYQETLRKFQGEQLRSQLEVHGQAALVDIQNKIELGQLTNLTDIQQKMESAIGGYTAPLARINPESAVRYQSSMATTAKTFYQQATKKLTDDYRNGQRMLAIDNYNATLKVQKSVIEATTDPVMYDQATSLNRQRIYKQALEGGSDFALKQVEEFDKAQRQMRNGFFTKTALSKEYAQNPTTGIQDISYAMQRMQAGDFGEHSAMFASLDQEEKDKIIKESYTMMTSQYEASKKQEDFIKTQKKQENLDKWTRVYNPTSTASKAEKSQIMYELAKDEYITKNEYEQWLNPTKEKDGNPVLAGELANLVWQGKIKDPETIKERAKGRLSDSQVGSLITLIGRRTNSVYMSKLNGMFKEDIKPWESSDFKKREQLDSAAQQLADDEGIPLDLALDKAQDKLLSSDKSAKALESLKGIYSDITVMPEYQGFNPDKESAANYAKRKSLSSRQAKSLQDNYEYYLKKKSEYQGTITWDSLKSKGKK